ncbi:MAG: Hsp20/alpha crystallin family protein [Verrucomicrobiota bacterium]
MNACNCPTEAAPSKEQNETIHRPQFRITEDANGTSVHVALPGVRKEDLKLTLHESSLRIEARRTDTGSARRYALSLRLSSRLDGTKTAAALESGLLTLQVPIREEAKPRQIAVN